MGVKYYVPHNLLIKHNINWATIGLNSVAMNNMYYTPNSRVIIEYDWIIFQAVFIARFNLKWNAFSMKWSNHIRWLLIAGYFWHVCFNISTLSEGNVASMRASTLYTYSSYSFLI